MTPSTDDTTALVRELRQWAKVCEEDDYPGPVKPMRDAANLLKRLAADAAEHCDVATIAYMCGQRDEAKRLTQPASPTPAEEVMREALETAFQALRPFASHVGKSGERVTLTIGKDTWTDTLTTEHFSRASAAVRKVNEARAALTKGPTA